jgi:hypothetical protein
MARTIRRVSLVNMRSSNTSPVAQAAMEFGLQDDRRVYLNCKIYCCFPEPLSSITNSTGMCPFFTLKERIWRKKIWQVAYTENFCGGHVCFENKTKNISEKQYTPDRIWTINCRQKFIDVWEEYTDAIFRVQKPRNQPRRCRKPSIVCSSVS